MTKRKQYPDNNRGPHVVGFVCNWGAYSGVEMAGVHQTRYPASVKLVKVMCLGRLHLGLVLKAFELGTDGVILLGCPPKDCYYKSGMENAKEVFTQAKKILYLLGIEPKRLSLVEVPLGRGDVVAKQVSAFVKSINRAGPSPLHSHQKIPSLA